MTDSDSLDDKTSDSRNLRAPRHERQRWPLIRWLLVSPALSVSAQSPTGRQRPAAAPAPESTLIKRRENGQTNAMRYTWCGGILIPTVCTNVHVCRRVLFGAHTHTHTFVHTSWVCLECCTPKNKQTTRFPRVALASRVQPRCGVSAALESRQSTGASRVSRSTRPVRTCESTRAADTECLSARTPGPRHEVHGVAPDVTRSTHTHTNALV
jgi:hypothetical protein